MLCKYVIREKDIELENASQRICYVIKEKDMRLERPL